MAISGLGLWLASEYVAGLVIDDGRALIMAAVLLGVVNAVVRPIVVFLTFPITIVTLGFFLLVVNAGMLGLVARLLDDFHIDDWSTALVGSVVVSLTSWVASWFIGGRGVESLGRRRR
jgi:putative membrane protein